MEPLPRRHHLAALTGLRFFAAIYVVLYHYQGAFTWAPGAVRNAIGHGNVGVNVFFVLSGFVLAYTYFNGDGRIARGQFWLARFARIYPVYLLALVLFAPVALTRIADGHVLLHGVSALTLTQAWTGYTSWNAPGWSLSAEAFFYLAFPLVMLLLRRLRARGLVLALGALWIAGLAAPIVYVVLGVSAEWQPVLYYNPLLRLPEFAMGVAAGRLFLLDPPLMRGDRRRAALATAAALGLIVFLAAAPAVPDEVLHNGLLDPLFVALVLGLAGGTGALAHLLARPRLVVLGEASYSVYILHSPVFLWLKGAVTVALFGRIPAGDRTLNDSLVFVLAHCVVLIAVALLTFCALELPARRWIRRLGADRAPAGSLPAAPASA
jgi:peptidoglycan/LPS O-acetylase OafA/YrhL